MRPLAGLAGPMTPPTLLFSVRTPFHLGPASTAGGVIGAAPRRATPSRHWLATQNPPAGTLLEGLSRLTTLERRLETSHDPRAVFAAVYILQIQALADDLKQPGRYVDTAWMTKMTLDFLQRYLDAFDAYDRGDLANVPKPWQSAFGRAKAGRAPVIADLLLAMNAHINHDLPIALASVGAGPQHLRDFQQFNNVLVANVPMVQNLLYTRFLRKEGSIESVASAALGPVDEWLTGALIVNWRALAWKNAQALTIRGKSAYPELERNSLWSARGYELLSDLTPFELVRRGLL
jgi:hypothetical protein